MKDLNSILKSLGLAESEIKIYLAALKYGASTVVQLAKYTKLSRQACYVGIEQMTERGLMSSVQHGKKRLFSAEPPDKLLAYAKRKELEMKERIHDLQEQLPTLKLQIGGEKPVVRLYEGKEGVQAFLADVQKDRPKEVYEIADADTLNALIPIEELAPVRNLLARIRSKVHGLYAKTGEFSTPEPEARHVLPNSMKDFKSNITLYGNKIALVSLEGKIYTVIIEDEHIAEGLRTLFKLGLKGLKNN